MDRGVRDERGHNPDIEPEQAEIDRLLRMAAYYQRLGCINVAVSLRAFAAAKKTKRAGGLDGREQG